MALLKTGKIVAAMLQGDTSWLSPLEKMALPLLRRMVPYKNSAVERWLYGQRMTLRMAKEGIDKYLVLGAGVPTSGHVHQLLPEAYVLYIDNDPEVVKLARRLIGDNPRVRYIEGDITQLHSLIPSEGCDLWRIPARLGIIFVGVSYFIPDDGLEKVFRTLYDWSAPGSNLVLSAGLRDYTKPLPIPFRLLLKTYALTGNKVYARSMEELEALARPWKLEEMEIIFDYGDFAKMYGCLFTK